MFSLKMLSLPLLANEKIIKMLDLPDLLRFASCSSKTADLVRLSNIILSGLTICVKQKCVNIEFEERVFNLVVNEKDYTGKDGFEWNGLGGLKFFESPAVGKGWDLPEGPFEDDLSDPGDDSNSEESDQESDKSSDAEESDEEAAEESNADESDENPEECSDENSDADSDPDSDEQDTEVSDEEYDYIDDSGDYLEPATGWYCKVSSSTSQTVFEVADHLITYLFDLFGSTELHHMALWPTEASKQLVEKHEQLQRCESLAIADFWTSEFCRPLTKELMEWSIDAVEAKDECTYHCNVIGEFKWDKGFKTRSVEVEYGHWVHQNAILDSQSHSLTFYRYLPSSNFINTLLKAWISHEKMKNIVEIQWETFKVDKITEAFCKRIMDGIPEATLTEEERKRVMPNGREGDGWDFFKVIRRIDGTLAEVFVESSSHTFNFSVC